jgi:hypothetical protein
VHVQLHEGVQQRAASACAARKIAGNKSVSSHVTPSTSPSSSAAKYSGAENRADLTSEAGSGYSVVAGEPRAAIAGGVGDPKVFFFLK